jgi:hypothetical protein
MSPSDFDHSIVGVPMDYIGPINLSIALHGNDFGSGRVQQGHQVKIHVVLQVQVKSQAGFKQGAHVMISYALFYYRTTSKVVKRLVGNGQLIHDGKE